MKKIFSYKKISKVSKQDAGKVAANNSTIITLIKRTPEELSKSRCSAYTYLIP